MSRSLSLLEEAAERLAAGPSHTLELARAVLALRGNESAASKAVFTLLGRDPRFLVDGEGYWRLDPEQVPPGRSLRRGRYAVVDVETTGGGSRGADRVTEVAIVHVEDGIVGKSFKTLVNPGRPIPPRIQGFTGITDRMVASAPPFEGVADEVRAWLDDRVFVAHNVSFDWGFITRELVRTTGHGLDSERLCTVRLGRLLLPRLRSHGLDSLTTHYRIPVEQRHRAFGDALATARLLLELLRAAEGGGISDWTGLENALQRRNPRARGRSRPGSGDNR
ncbi:MAG: 3'-5' exonuclease [Gemmatimonadota bacterium]